MKALFLSYGLLLAGSLCAQNFRLENYNPDHGLPSSELYDIVHDDYGYLWISTDKGLSRYNGYEFENFDISDGLIDNVIFDFHKRPTGEIWCTTNSAELFIISGKEPIFQPYAHNDTIRKYAHNLIPQCLYFSQAGELYLAFNHYRGFLKLSPKGEVLAIPQKITADLDGLTVNVFKDTIQEPFFFSDCENSCDTLLADIPYSSSQKHTRLHRKEALFLGSQAGTIYTFGCLTETDGKLSNRTGFENGKSIISSGRTADYFWLGYRNGGVAVYSLEGEKQFHLLERLSVSQFYLDNEQNIWITTLENGLYRSAGSDMLFLSETKGKTITSLSSEADSTLYVGEFNGTILRKKRGATFETYYRCRSRHTPALITYDHDMHMSYLSSDVLHSQHGKIYHHPVKYLTYADGYLYYGLYQQTVQRNLSTEVEKECFKGKRLKDVTSFNHKIYGGGLDGLVSTDLTSSTDENSIISGVRINNLTKFAGQLVLGTNGQGLMLMDSLDNITQQITKKNGLSSNFINKTFARNDSTLWVCTNKGLSKITFRKDQSVNISNFTTQNGLLSNEVWDMTIVNDTAWIGTQNGLNFAPVQTLNKEQTCSINYNLQWTAITANDEPVMSNHHFSHDQNKFVFRFLGISFTYEHQLEYRYQLRGFDNKWNTTTNRSITYLTLPPGKYELLVEVKGRNKQWKDNQIRYAFTITPPYWRSWWFIVLTTGFFTLMIYSFFKVRILTYNKDIVREILRYTLRKIKPETAASLLIKHNGKDVRLPSADIYFVKSSGNYLELYTKSKTYIIRSSIPNFLNQLPDQLEFIQVHRSYIIRLEHVQQKGKKELTILNQNVPVGRKYQAQLSLIKL